MNRYLLALLVGAVTAIGLWDRGAPAAATLPTAEELLNCLGSGASNCSTDRTIPGYACGDCQAGSGGTSVMCSDTQRKRECDGYKQAGCIACQTFDVSCNGDTVTYSDGNCSSNPTVEEGNTCNFSRRPEAFPQDCTPGPDGIVQGCVPPAVEGREAAGPGGPGGGD